MANDPPPPGDDRAWRDDDTSEFPRQPGTGESQSYGGRFVGDNDGEVYDSYDQPPRFSEEEFAGVRGEAPPPMFGGTRRGLPLEDEPRSIVAPDPVPTREERR